MPKQSNETKQQNTETRADTTSKGTAAKECPASKPCVSQDLAQTNLSPATLEQAQVSHTINYAGKEVNIRCQFINNTKPWEFLEVNDPKELSFGFLSDENNIFLARKFSPALRNTAIWQIPLKSLESQSSNKLLSGPPSAGLTSACVEVHHAQTDLNDKSIRRFPKDALFKQLLQALKDGEVIDPLIFSALYFFDDLPSQTKYIQKFTEYSGTLNFSDIQSNASYCKELYSGKFIKLIQSHGKEVVCRTRGAGAVIIPCVTNEQELILIEQERRPLGKIAIEWPAGLVADNHSGETILESAKKELMEECGYQPDTLQQVLLCPAIGRFSDELISFVIASNAVKIGIGGGVEGEHIVTHKIPYNSIDSWLKEQEENGKLIDPKVYAGLFFLRILGKTTS